MPVPSLITDLSQTASVNSPAGTESAKGTVDDYFRAHAAFIRQTYDRAAGATSDLASAATVNIGAANTLNVRITGTTTITAFDTVAEGQIRNVVFAGALTLTQNATSLILPGAANITTAANDVGVFKSLGSGNWLCLAYTRASGAVVATSLNGGPLAGPRNRIINGNFAINCRAVSGTVTLAAGAYGHDRWKAGAGGCTYTFATSGNDTIITISAGSLQQVIESGNVEGGVYAFSHTGTAQARIAVNGAATSGSYAALSASNPLLSASATANQAITVELGIGTLNKVMLETGSTATPFERRPIGLERMLCERYAYAGTPPLRGYSLNTTNFARAGARHPVPMRGTPTVTLNGQVLVYDGGTTTQINAISLNNSTPEVLEIDASVLAANLTTGRSTMIIQGGTGNLIVSAEL